MRRVIAAGVASVALIFATPSEANERLAAAEVLLKELRYAQAAIALDEARRVPQNDRSTLVRIRELQGIVSAQLNRPEDALEHFKAVLTLDPSRELPAGLAPRVKTPFFEARGWAKRNGALEARTLAPAVSPGRVETVGLELVADPLGLSRAARFHLRADGGEWQQQVLVLEGGKQIRAAPPFEGGALSWWAELLGEHDAVLQTFGSAGTPLEVQAPAAPKAAAPTVAATPSSAAVALTETNDRPQGAGLPLHRQIAVGVFAGAGVAAIAGTVFGVRSTGARAEIAGAGRGPDGEVTGITQRRAHELDQRAQGAAVTANVLFGATAIAAAAGGGLWFFGDRIGIFPSAGAVQVQGRLP